MQIYSLKYAWLKGDGLWYVVILSLPEHDLCCREVLTDWLIDWTLFLNSEDISTKADARICRCYSTANNQDIQSEILLQKDIDKYSISKNKI